MQRMTRAVWSCCTAERTCCEPCCCAQLLAPAQHPAWAPLTLQGRPALAAQRLPRPAALQAAGAGALLRVAGALLGERASSDQHAGFGPCRCSTTGFPQPTPLVVAFLSLLAAGAPRPGGRPKGVGARAEGARRPGQAGGSPLLCCANGRGRGVCIPVHAACIGLTPVCEGQQEAEPESQLGGMHSAARSPFLCHSCRKARARAKERERARERRKKRARKSPVRATGRKAAARRAGGRGLRAGGLSCSRAR